MHFILTVQGFYTSEETLVFSTRVKIHLKCDVIDGSVLNGVRESKLFSFILDKTPGNKIFCELRILHYKQINKFVLNTLTFYLEDNKNEKINFYGETLNFTLQMIKI